VPPEAVGDALADAYNALHDEELSMFPDAHETLDRLKELDVKLALITNGAAETQRAKVVRFALEHRFDHIQIEGEHGFGKPEERAYNHAMEVLGVGPHETWMVGDNLEWEIVAPQRLASTRSGTTATASACPPTPRSAPTASSAAYRNCWSSRAAWCASNGTRQSSN
jgi:putative hydrolase of the HAD superfamily